MVRNRPAHTAISRVRRSTQIAAPMPGNSPSHPFEQPVIAAASGEGTRRAGEAQLEDEAE